LSEVRTESPVVCAIAIPHYGNRRYLRGYLAAMVNKLVAQAIETGVKSLEVRSRPGIRGWLAARALTSDQAVQAFVLLSQWSHATSEKESIGDRTWMFLGLAIRYEGFGFTLYCTMTGPNR
jgi:hypothetical protein